MLVSVIIPACDAQTTILRTLRSVLAQTWQDWEAIVVADDQFDYANWVAAQGVLDGRIRFVSTGGVRTGCHRARNVGLRAAQGELIAALDADDLFLPPRLATLAPLAIKRGAAADNLSIVLDATETELYRVMGPIEAAVDLDLDTFFRLSAPLVPIVRRDHALPRTEGVEYAEDVIANAQLIDRIGRLPVLPQPFYDYRVIIGSISHTDRSSQAFDAAYASYIERVTAGDGLGLSASGRLSAARGLAGKRELNALFAAALAADSTLNFQTFVAGRARATEHAGV